MNSGDQKQEKQLLQTCVSYLFSEVKSSRLNPLPFSLNEIGGDEDADSFPDVDEHTDPAGDVGEV